VLLAEPSLLRLDPPIRVCGDLHGQFLDLLRVFELGGMPPESSYLFLGDYVDRGERSVEVIILLFALKLRFPRSIFLLRGNHESPEMTEVFGFADECRRKLDDQIWPHFLKAFDTLPIAALIGSSFFCVHGGLSPDLATPADVNQIIRPTEIHDSGLMSDLLWSDPHPEVDEWGPNDRGATITWGLRVAQTFLDRNGLLGIVRAHQMAMDGFHFPFGTADRRIVTVFTASHYAGEYANKAAVMEIEVGAEPVFKILSRKIPHLRIQAIEKKESARSLTTRRFVPAKASPARRQPVRRLL
jgi:serine/threonine-protein phosphatase PP1 catalytic subunit